MEKINKMNCVELSSSELTNVQGGLWKEVVTWCLAAYALGYQHGKDAAS